MRFFMQDRWLQSVHSDGSPMFVSPAYPVLGDKVSLQLRILKSHPLRQIFLRTIPEGEQILTQMVLAYEDDIFAWYQCQVALITSRLNYRFMLVGKQQVYWYNQAGIFEYDPGNVQDFVLLANWKEPNWITSSIFYQIFPDTFCRGKAQPNLAAFDYEYEGRKPILKEWHEQPGEYSQTGSMDFFAGDLAGIEQKIGYLQELGANALYLNPVFAAPSNHRYDIQDYFLIDPKLGTNQEFAQLTTRLKQDGIYMILDGIFNHCGIANRFFNRCQYYPEPGAYQDADNPYSEFFTFYKHPDEYACWLGVDTLPKLNYRSQKLRDIMYRDQQSVMQFWLDHPYEIDGWRLDVANMMARQDEYQGHREMFYEMRQTIKSRFANSYLLGEHFFDGTELLQGDALDAVMNYWGFCFPVRQWLSGVNYKHEPTRLNAIQFSQQLEAARTRIPWMIAKHQYNLINSHDIARLLSVVSHQVHDLANLLLFTYPGVPSIYYGDEIGLGSGKSSQSARQPMVWDRQRWNHNTWQRYQQLIQLRKNHRTLQTGSFKTLLVNEQIYSFARFDPTEIILVIINHGPSTRVTIDAGVVGIHSGQMLLDFANQNKIKASQDGLLELKLAAESGIILQAKQER